MNKIDVMTFKGALKHLGISNKTFYDNYRPYIQSCGMQGRSCLYKVSDLDKRKKDIEDSKNIHEKFNIIA